MNKYLRNFSAVLLLCFGSVVNAAEHPAQTLIVNTVDGLLTLMRDEGERIKSDTNYLKEQLEIKVVPHIDFEIMAKRAVGKNWKKASDSQKKELVLEYKKFLLNTYTSAVTEYKGGTVDYEKFRPEKREDRAVVRSTFKQSGSAAVPVLYKLYDNGGWKIWDIEVSQLSLITNNRSFFSSEIERNGIDGLIKLLKEKNNS